MSLTSGTRLGAYEVVALLGAGGMGEVYRARDSRLQRDVAIKILPAAFAAAAERLARFAREAQVLASLNHPHIAHVYGFDGGSTSSDPPRLVMELVDGPTLADRIARGPNPPWTTRCRSRDRSGMRWRPPISAASSIAISNPRTSS